MTTLYLAEKSAVARDLATILGVKSKDVGFWVTPTGDFISHAVGHLVEALDPHEYHAEWKTWNLAYLPMVPEVWKVTPHLRTKAQLMLLGKLLKSCTRVVIATDAGREGEMIGREILDFFKFNGKIERMWPTNMVLSEMKKALASLKTDAATRPYYEAALARRGADWIYGLSMTRAVSIVGNVDGPLPVGRVQTPTLTLLVNRHKAIKAFKEVTYYELEAKVKTKEGHALSLFHKPAEDKRILTEREAMGLASKANGAEGELVVTCEPKKQAPPLPFKLTTLSRACSSAFGLTAKGTLEIAQVLYEKHKVLTYPRTDSEYLGTDQKLDMPDVIEAVRATLPGPVAALLKQGTLFRPNLFDDKKLTDHHGIIPTIQAPEGLKEIEMQVYRLVALQFLRAMGQDKLYDQTVIKMDANGLEFATTGNVMTSPGWTLIEL